jgi:hypothetical protein
VRRRNEMRKWTTTAVVSAIGLGVYAVAAANGYAWEMLWLPAVTVGAAWPHEPDSRLKTCLRQLRHAREKRG